MIKEDTTFPYKPLVRSQKNKNKLISIKCIICKQESWWAYMSHIIEPLDKRKKKHGICLKKECQESFQSFLKSL